MSQSAGTLFKSVPFVYVCLALLCVLLWAFEYNYATHADPIDVMDALRVELI